MDAVVAPVAAAAVSVALAEASRATRLWTRRERRRCPPVLFAATAELTRYRADECLNFLYRGVGLAYVYAPDAEAEEVSDAQGFACITERGWCDGDNLLG